MKRVMEIGVLHGVGDAAMSNELITEGCTKKVIVKHLKDIRKVACGYLKKYSLSSSRNSKSKGPGVGVCLGCQRHKKAR